MRIYDRSGIAQYDSALQPERVPSVALTQARENTLTPKKLDELSQGYQRSISQGQNLAQVLKDNPKVDNALIDTHLSERASLNAQGHLEQTGQEVQRKIRNQTFPQTITDLHNPAIQTIGGLERRELVAMHETLTAKHGYSSALADEAVHARVTVQTALNDHLAGKTPSTDLTRSQQVLQQTASVLKDTPHQYNINQQITATHQMHNGASNDFISHTLTATPKPLQPSSPFHQAHTNPAPEVKLNNPPVEHGPPNGFSTHRAWEAEQRAAQLELSRTINQPVIEAEARTRAMQTVQRQELNAARQASLEVGSLTQSVDTTSHTRTATKHLNIGGKAAGVASVLVEGATVFNDVENARQNAPTFREQHIQGGGALATGVVRSVLTNGAGLGAGVLTVEASPIASFVAGSAAAVGMDKLYTDSALDKGATRVGQTWGSWRYEQTSEAKLGHSVDQQRQVLSQTPAGATHDNLAETLRFTNQSHARESQYNQNQVTGTYTIAKGFKNFIEANPQYRDMSMNRVIQNVEALTRKNVEATVAVKEGYASAIREQTEQEKGSLSLLSQKGQARAAEIHAKNPGASWTDAIELTRLEGRRSLVVPGPGGITPVGELLYKSKLEEIEQNNQKADRTYGKDPITLRMEDINLATRTKTDLYKESHGSAVTPTPPKPPELGRDLHDKRLTQSVQHMLSYVGHPVQANGHYGSATFQAAKAFQKSHGLTQDGTLGQHDFAVLNKAVKQHTQHLATQHDLATLGYDVKATGKLDAQTQHAIYAFEKDHNLKPNGTLNAHDKQTLRQAATHERNSQLQNALTELGYPVQATGKLDTDTQQAIKAFEREHHLKEDGKLSPKDAQVLNEALQQHRTTQVQTTLNTLGAQIAVDGQMGKDTIDAVKAFQTTHDLPANGKL
ncbi:MAG: peptidoglycan-binding domain-containing protein, partial [Formosimonas sp.]